MEEEKYKELEFTTASIEELEERLEECKKVDCGMTYCSACPKARYYNLVYTKQLNCDNTIEVLELIIENAKQQKAPEVEKVTPTGECSQCEKLDKSSGYYFCTHWHNFTTLNGFCHEFTCKTELQDVI